MFIEDDEKDGRRSALEKLKGMMRNKMRDKLDESRKPKMPVAPGNDKIMLDGEKNLDMERGDEGEEQGEGAGDGGIPEEEREMIRKLYAKHG